MITPPPPPPSSSPVVKRRREEQRKHRRQSTVSLVGYTNVGKSTLLNALTGSDAVSVVDRPFETLDTTTRGLFLPDLGPSFSCSCILFIHSPIVFGSNSTSP
jgi:50S ribosomal subunit-associated GTPase HflX